ncbi:hypothetical protein IRJ41_006216 [Triplophysa rosa]|uniref:Phosphatidylinositol-specific phospholipase C X domain-containing protein n=1 Tax=Triplophysa rosa TaxID=992332 RepID=A0A9W7WQH0_TRIRA|nr:hypothetical protein IRJ41_006216 [Triplophysa rosa]
MGAPGLKLFSGPPLQKSSGQLQIFNDQKTLILPDFFNIGWMATLDDNKLISEITIPGTHDALALHGGPLAKCQAWSLEDQLKAGIRYFDLRVSGEGLKIKHGIFDQNITFPEVQNTIKIFLSAYPTEIVLVRVKPVSSLKKKVPDLVENKINKAISWVDSSMPRIGQVRGKIVYVQKNNFKLGVPLTETDEKGDYRVTNVEKKMKKIREHLDRAKESLKNGSRSLFMSYSSGTGIGTIVGLLKWLTPKRVAEKINPLLYNYLQCASNENPKPYFGIIAMDFPGFDLIQMVIDPTTESETNNLETAL